MGAASPVKAGILYWGLMFGAGFALGSARALLIAPTLGETTAVLLELPVMLAICWWAAGLVLRHWPLSTGQALACGAIAFGLLMAAELATAAMFFGVLPGDWLAGLSRFPGWLGLAAQALAALFPRLRAG